MNQQPAPPVPPGPQAGGQAGGQAGAQGAPAGGAQAQGQPTEAKEFSSKCPRESLHVPQQKP